MSWWDTSAERILFFTQLLGGISWRWPPDVAETDMIPRRHAGREEEPVQIRALTRGSRNILKEAAHGQASAGSRR